MHVVFLAAGILAAWLAVSVVAGVLIGKTLKKPGKEPRP